MREHARRARRLVNVFFLFHSAALLRLVVRDVVDLGIFERASVGESLSLN